MSTRKRIQKEYNEILQQTNKFCVELIENDLFKWRATFKAPTGTPYSNGEYILHININDNYPLKAPSVRFINPPYCLNVAGHDDYKHNLQKDGYISFNKLNDMWSPALKINALLQELYDDCFYACGYDKHFDIKHPPSTGEIFLNIKYKLYSFKPREFLYKVSRYNELYGNGDTAIYYILPQMDEMKYFKNVSIIDNILRDTYKCNEDIIEQCLMFYGLKINYCGLYNDKFRIPPFNGIEDEEHQNEQQKRTNYRTYDEIETDICDGKSIGIAMGAIHGCASRIWFKGCDTLTVADLKVIYHHKKGHYWFGDNDVESVKSWNLIYGGKILNEERQIKDYNYKEDFTIYVTTRLYGG